MWIVSWSGVTVVGADARGAAPPSASVSEMRGTDLVLAIDDRTGRLLWSRSDLPTFFAAGLGADQLLVAGDGVLEVLEPRSGRSLGSATASPNIVAVCRDVDGRHYVKTSGELVAFDAARGTMVWTVPASFPAAPAPVGRWIVDAWVDANRYGLDVHDRTDGRRVRRIELGAVTARDFMRILLAPAGPDRVAVDAEFAWE